jgi:hypothetical protein
LTSPSVQKVETLLSSPLVEEKPIDLEGEGVVGAIAAAEEEPPLLPTRKSIGLPKEKLLTSPSVEKAEKLLSSPLVEEKHVVLESEGVVGAAAAEEEELLVAAPPHSPVR